jgi:sugar lactone lactonase YvrE
MRLEPVLTGLDFPECPRWHDGALWWSDMQREQVLRWRGTDGEVPEVVAALDEAPGGLGWDANGTLLVVTMFGRRLLAIDADATGATAVRHDLTALVPGMCNDMVVAPSGTAYVGTMDALLPQPLATDLLAVTAAGRVHVAASDLMRPNGCVVTPDGRRLVVAESAGARLTAFRLADDDDAATDDDDGTLHDRHVWAALPGARPDGICIDEEGAIWVADLAAHAVVRVLEGGAVTARISTGERYAVACVLGGSDGRTLHVCTCAHLAPFAGGEPGTGRIEVAAVEVAG